MGHLTKLCNHHTLNYNEATIRQVKDAASQPTHQPTNHRTTQAANQPRTTHANQPASESVKRANSPSDGRTCRPNKQTTTETILSTQYQLTMLSWVRECTGRNLLPPRVLERGCSCVALSTCGVMPLFFCDADVSAGLSPLLASHCGIANFGRTCVCCMGVHFACSAGALAQHHPRSANAPVVPSSQRVPVFRWPCASLRLCMSGSVDCLRTVS
jgi:hypothetical protein